MIEKFCPNGHVVVGETCERDGLKAVETVVDTETAPAVEEEITATDSVNDENENTDNPAEDENIDTPDDESIDDEDADDVVAEPALA